MYAFSMIMYKHHWDQSKMKIYCITNSINTPQNSQAQMFLSRLHKLILKLGFNLAINYCNTDE